MGSTMQPESPGGTRLAQSSASFEPTAFLDFRFDLGIGEEGVFTLIRLRPRLFLERLAASGVNVTSGRDLEILLI